MVEDGIDEEYEFDVVTGKKHRKLAGLNKRNLSAFEMDKIFLDDIDDEVEDE
jgi:hypothetical protein